MDENSPFSLSREKAGDEGVNIGTSPPFSE